LILAQAAMAATVPPSFALATAKAAKAFRGGTAAGRPAMIAGRVMRTGVTKLAVAGVIAALVVALGGVLLWPRPKPVVTLNDRALSPGAWSVVPTRIGDMTSTDMFGSMIVIDSQAFRIQDFVAPYSIDPDQTPKTIDLSMPFGPNGQPTVLLGVYEFTDTQLRINFAWVGEPRPVSTTPVPGRPSMLLVVERAGGRPGKQ